MEAHLIDFLSMMMRWLGLVPGSSTSIGSSFYFIWLDNSIEAPAADSEAARKGPRRRRVVGGASRGLF